METYRIPFVGLKTGKHDFDYFLDKKFFDRFEGSIIQNAEIRAHLILDKRENMLALDFEIDGTINVECDRCLQLFDQKVFGDYSLIIKFKDAVDLEDNTSEDVIFISRNESHLNVEQYLYEFSLLSKPMSSVHEEDESGNSLCDPEVLKVLNQKSKTEEDLDPRWEQLKEIKIKKK